MNARYVITRGLAILTVASTLAAMAWVNEIDRRAERMATHHYCEGVAVWTAEAARGVHPLHRTGHPDYHGIAAEQCPGMRPAGPPAPPTAAPFPYRQVPHLVQF